MWKPSITYNRLGEPASFDEIGAYYNDFYIEYLTQFRILWECVKDIHIKNGMELALTRGITSSVKGSLILVVRMRPTYPYGRSDSRFDPEEKLNYETEYGTEFTMTIVGQEHEYLSSLGFKAIKKGSILVAAIESFDTNDYDKQIIPTWFIETVNEFAK